MTSLDVGLFHTDRSRFDIAIVNPPYKKFRSESRVRQFLRRLGIETSNLYAAFLALVVSLLDEEGELVATHPGVFVMVLISDHSESSVAERKSYATSCFRCT